MNPSHTFKDEWIIKAIESLSLPADVLDGLRKSGEPFLARALLRQGVVPWETFSSAITKTFGVPCLDLSVKNVEKMALSLLTQADCETLQVLPLHVNNNTIVVAMANPLDAAAKDHVRLMSARSVDPCYALPDKIDALIPECYADDLMMVDLIEKLEVPPAAETPDPAGKNAGTGEEAGTLERFINDLIAKAVAMEAAEIHWEHGRTTSEVRFLIDGRPRTVLTVPKALNEGPLTARIKTLAGLDPLERRRPQEGRAKVRVEGREIGLRVFIQPSVSGEKIVLRLLDERIAALAFDDLGLRPAIGDKLKTFLRQPRGLIVVSGPAGSGITTLLYALVNTLKADGVKLATVENPIEFKMSGIAQVEVNDKLGLTYPTALRSALRVDPQAVLVGELRDAETAGVALQAAMNGRRILTTVHTEDALSALTRLIDMGLDPKDIAGAVLGVLSQRVVRRLCPACRKPIDASSIDPAIAAALKFEGFSNALHRASGCEECHFTGYRGRFALVELVSLSEPLKRVLNEKLSETELRREASAAQSFESLHRDALWHLSQGNTTPAEVMEYLALESHRAATPSGGPETPAPVGTPAPAPAQRRILVADDDPLIRSVIRKTLENQGYLVDEAVDGLQALAKAAELKPDMILLDLEMPGMDGLASLKLLRRKMGMVKLPIILMTESEEEQPGALAGGADDTVLKPVKPAIIAARINAVFRRNASPAGSVNRKPSA